MKVRLSSWRHLTTSPTCLDLARRRLHPQPFPSPSANSNDGIPARWAHAAATAIPRVAPDQRKKDDLERMLFNEIASREAEAEEKANHRRLEDVEQPGAAHSKPARQRVAGGPGTIAMSKATPGGADFGAFGAPPAELEATPALEGAAGQTKKTQEEILDELAELFRTRFRPDASVPPTLADLESLRPTRLGPYVAGMIRPYYIDAFNISCRRIVHAFHLPHLAGFAVQLGWNTSMVKVLTVQGSNEVNCRCHQDPKQKEREHRMAVLATGNPEWVVEKRRPKSARFVQGRVPKASVSKIDIAEWIMCEKWGATHPSTIPKDSFAKLAMRHRTGEDLFEISQHEAFLLNTQLQERVDGISSLLALARKHSVTVEITADPTPTLRILGPVGSRRTFWLAFSRHRRPCVSRRLPLPAILGLIPERAELDTGSVQRWCKAISSAAGAYIAVVSKPPGDAVIGEQNSVEPREGARARTSAFVELEVEIWAYDEASLDVAEQTVKQLDILDADTRRQPVLLNVAPSQLVDSHSQGSQNASSLCLFPFTPRSPPPHVATITEGYGRFTLSKATVNSVQTGGVAPKLSLVSKHESLGASDFPNLPQWLASLPDDPLLSKVYFRATFGHWVYPLASASGVTVLGPGGSCDLRRRLEDFNVGSQQYPLFIPAPLSTALLPPLADAEDLLQEGPSLEDAVMVMPTRHVHVYSSAQPNGLDTGVFESLLVSHGKHVDEINIRRIVQRRVVVMLPDQPMDVELIAERYSTEDISDPTGGAYTPDCPSFILPDGREFIRTDSYVSQHTTTSNTSMRRDYGLQGEILIQHERRRDLRSAAREPSLRTEISASAADVDSSDFIAAAQRLAATPYPSIPPVT